MPTAVTELDGSDIVETAVGESVVRSIAHKIAVVPEGFNINPKMVGQLARRAKMGEGALPMDWAFAEAVAFGSLVLDRHARAIEWSGLRSRHFQPTSRCSVRYANRRELGAAL